MGRRGYLDWLRGAAVLIMVEAHLLDAWVSEGARDGRPYQWAMMLGGISAPVFLFLAGVALVLAAGGRARTGVPVAEVAALARRRGWQIVGLAFLFRLQSYLISGGVFPRTLLQVDILNIMGLSMLLAALIWGAFATMGRRAAALIGAATAIALVTPIVRASPLPAALPVPFGWYLLSVPGSGVFSLFPWPAFLLAGAATGLWLDRARTEESERRLLRWLAGLGSVLALGGYAASFLPPIYETTSFWTGSPTFFAVRLGIVLATLPLAYAWSRAFPGRSPLRELGVASLFVYWIHVEMVYGVVALPLHRSLSFWQAALACLPFCVLLFALVKLKNRLRGAWRLPEAPVTAARPASLATRS